MKTRNFPAKRVLRRARANGLAVRVSFVDDQRHRVGRAAYEDVVRELKRGWTAFEGYDGWNPTLGYAPPRP